MKRPWQVWIVFTACVFGAVGAMAWLTRELVEADRQRRTAQTEAELEQRVSLAVWRMDTELAPIIAAEVIRPASAFRPGSIVGELPPFVLLQFQILPGDVWQSPQAPPTKGPPAARLAELSSAVQLQPLLAELPNTPLPTAADVARNQLNFNGDWSGANGANAQVGGLDQSIALNASNQVSAQQQVSDNRLQFFEGNRGNNYPNAPQQAGQQAANAAPQQLAQAPAVQQSKEADFQQRSKRYQSAAQQTLINTSQAEQFEAPPLAGDGDPFSSGDVAREPKAAAGERVDAGDVNGGKVPGAPIPGKVVSVPEQVGVSRPVWIGDKLILARRVTRQTAPRSTPGDGDTIVQGCWVDWPRLKARLLSEASDLFPRADLVPVNGNGAEDPSRMLAGLPVRLVVNETPSSASIGPALRSALWLGWGAVLVAVLAAATLLHGVMTLSERRAAFVSSVTHELRTPLTTFRMYAEMLAKGMVPEASRRQEYYETLQRESERLTLLVENVLSYARLERGRKPQAQDRVTVRGVLERVRTRLEQRAAQAGMECVITFNSLPLPPGEGRGEGVLKASKAPSPCPLPKGEGLDQTFTTDLAVVEQILFNLVDNAAKYARTATDRRIHVEANHQDKFVTFAVRDHGPGIGGATAERSQPFEKSAQESAETAPGVGLGLALCRRLARELGGRLEVAGANGEGAMVTLMLPA